MSGQDLKQKRARAGDSRPSLRRHRENRRNLRAAARQDIKKEQEEQEPRNAPPPPILEPVTWIENDPAAGYSSSETESPVKEE
jgi:hypothetical protein